MKKSILFSLLLNRYFWFVSLASFSSIVLCQTTEFTVTWAFKGIVEGYDHNSKTELWLGDELKATSAETLESQGGSMVVDIPMGTHFLAIVNMAEYEGQWEEHSVENDYSIDCLWEGEHTFSKKKEKMFLLFDIDNGTTVSWNKMPKPKK